MTRMDEANSRLDKALRQLEGALDSLIERASEPGAAQRERALLIADRDRLAADLDAALERGDQLESLAEEASAALGDAIREVRETLQQADSAALAEIDAKLGLTGHGEG